jgi:hypothetical protein
MISFKLNARWLAAIAVAGVTTVGSAVTFQVNEWRSYQFAVHAEYPNALVPLNDKGDTEVFFTQADTEERVLHYSADCDRDFSWWIELDILVNGVAVPLTAGNRDAFCGAGSGSSGRPSIAVAIQPRAGENTLQIRASLFDDYEYETGWLSNASLLVY